MGNCLRNNKVSAQDHDHDHDHENYYETPAKVEKIMKVPSAPSSKRVEEISMKKKKKKKKMVRLKMENEGACEGGGDGNCTSVRIRVVMSQEELKRMLRCCKDEAHHTSLEQLLDAVRLRGGRVSEVGEADHKGITSWKPSLDSIPEDTFMNLD